MQERVHLVHGTFSLESKIGKGTRIVAEVPMIADNCGSLEVTESKQTPGTMGAR
jgi:hypothetical protein